MYYTLFRINAFNYNKLVPHATVGPALMQVSDAGVCWRVTRWNARAHACHAASPQEYARLCPVNAR